MAEQDAMGKRYMQDNRIFADAFNFLIYGGRPVIKPEALQEADTTEIALPYGNNVRRVVQRYRDLKKIWAAKQDGKAVYVLLGDEIQSRVHYAMPVKDMLYDALEYTQQVEDARRSYQRKGDTGEVLVNGRPEIRLTDEEFLSGFRKTDKLLPIVTAVVYFGPDEWDGPLSLHEMMDVEDEELFRVVPNYFINLIAPARIEDADFDKFHTDLGIALKLLKYQNKGIGRAIRDLNHRKVSRLTAEFINVQAKLNLVFEEPSKEGEVDMCKAMEDFINEERADEREKTTKTVTKAVTKAVTEKVTKAVTKKVTKAVTTKVTKAVTEKVTETTLLQNIKSMMKNLNLTSAQAFTALEVPVADRPRLAGLL